MLKYWLNFFKKLCQSINIALEVKYSLPIAGLLSSHLCLIYPWLFDNSCWSTNTSACIRSVWRDGLKGEIADFESMRTRVLIPTFTEKSGGAYKSQHLQGESQEDTRAW